MHKIEVEQLHSQIKDWVIESDLQKLVNSTTQRKRETKDASISVKDDIIRKDSELEAAARVKQDKVTNIFSLLVPGHHLSSSLPSFYSCVGVAYGLYLER